MANEQTVPDWRRFADGLRGFVARRVPHRDADDVAQDVLLRLHQNAHTLRDTSRAEAWVFAVARRTIADYYRARPAGAVAAGIEGLDSLDSFDPADSFDPPDPAGSPVKGFGAFAGDHTVHEEVLGWLRPTVEELPAGYRDALLMADFEGRTQREVAAALGLSLSGAKSRVQRARRLLAERLQRCCELAVETDGQVVDFRRREPCGCQSRRTTPRVRCEGESPDR